MLDDGWTWPTVDTLTFNWPGDELNFAAPSFTSCELAVDSADLTFEFFHVGDSDITELSFFEYNPDDGQIYIEASSDVFKAYLGQTIAVLIRVTDETTDQNNIDIFLAVFFEDFIKVSCDASEIIEPEPIEGPWVVEVFAEEFIYELSETIDTGTLTI